MDASIILLMILVAFEFNLMRSKDVWENDSNKCRMFRDIESKAQWLDRGSAYLPGTFLELFCEVCR